jgi:hypothetical protein
MSFTKFGRSRKFFSKTGPWLFTMPRSEIPGSATALSRVIVPTLTQHLYARVLKEKNNNATELPASSAMAARGEENEGPSSSKHSKFENESKGHTDVGRNTNEKPIRHRPITEIDRRIFTYVSELFPFSTARFGILQLGPLCNASESCSFTEANCHVKTVMNEDDLALVLEFNQLFSKGIQFLSDVNENKRDFEEHELAAIGILDDFFMEKGEL